MRQQREFSGGCRCIAPAVVQRRRWAVRRTKKKQRRWAVRRTKFPPAALAPSELVPEAVEPPPGWVNSLQPSNTQSGKFRTSYDQVTHLDSGRCKAPAPPSSCGLLHPHNSGTTKSGEFRTPYDQAPRLDSGRYNAPAPNLSCGWLK